MVRSILTLLGVAVSSSDAFMFRKGDGDIAIGAACDTASDKCIAGSKCTAWDETTEKDVSGYVAGKARCKADAVVPPIEDGKCATDDDCKDTKKYCKKEASVEKGECAAKEVYGENDACVVDAKDKMCPDGKTCQKDGEKFTCKAAPAEADPTPKPAEKKGNSCSAKDEKA